jgi:hypothetical protein
MRICTLLLTALIPLAGCIVVVDEPVCTALYAYGVTATVIDADTGTLIDNATLTLTEGDYTEVMEMDPSGDYVGAGERAGTYTLTATAPGYQQKVTENIVVTADECHVIGVHVYVPLQREE